MMKFCIYSVLLIFLAFGSSYANYNNVQQDNCMQAHNSALDTNNVQCYKSQNCLDCLSLTAIFEENKISFMAINKYFISPFDKQIYLYINQAVENPPPIVFI